MKKTILSFLLILFFGCADLGAVILKPATKAERAAIDSELFAFYGRELLKAGLFDDYETAVQAGTMEWNWFVSSDANRTFYYAYLIPASTNEASGYIIYSILDETATIDAIFIKECFRGQGIGTATLNKLEGQLRDRDIACIELQVFAHNHRAYELYRRLGYGIKETFSDRSRIICRRMEKHL